MARDQDRVLNMEEICFHVQATLDKLTIKMHVRGIIYSGLKSTLSRQQCRKAAMGPEKGLTHESSG